MLKPTFLSLLNDIVAVENSAVASTSSIFNYLDL